MRFRKNSFRAGGAPPVFRPRSRRTCLNWNCRRRCSARRRYRYRRTPVRKCPRRSASSALCNPLGYTLFASSGRTGTLNTTPCLSVKRCRACIWHLCRKTRKWSNETWERRKKRRKKKKKKIASFASAHRGWGWGTTRVSKRIFRSERSHFFVFQFDV